MNVEVLTEKLCRKGVCHVKNRVDVERARLNACQEASAEMWLRHHREYLTLNRM